MILKSSISVTAIAVLSILISFINQLMLADFFGASASVDAYLIAISIPTLLSGTIVAALSYSIVPFLVHYNFDQKKYYQFCGAMLIGIVILACFVSTIGFFTSRYFLLLLGSMLPLSVFDEAVFMSHIAWVTAGFAIVSAYLAAMHNSAKHFIRPAIAGIFPYIGMILFIVFWGKHLSVVSIVWGMFVGTILSIVFQLTDVYKHIEISRNSFVYVKDVVRCFSIMPMVIISMACFTIYQSIDAYWAPRLGSGNLAYLGYCQRILIALGQFIIAGPSIVIMPRLSEAHRDGRHIEFFNDMSRVVRTVLVFASPLAVAVSVLAVPIVEVLFQRGAFDRVTTVGVATLIPFMMLGMVPMLCVVMMFRAFFSKKNIFIVTFLGFLMTVLYFTLSGILSGILGVKGIGLAYAFSWWIIMFLSMYFLWRQNLDLLLCKENFNFLLQLLVINIIVGIVVFLLGHFTISPIEEVGLIGLILRLGILVCVALIVFYFLSVRFFKIRDIKDIFVFIENNVFRVFFKRVN